MATLTVVNFLIGVTAVAAVAGAVQSRKAGKEQRRQNQIQNRIAATKRVRSIRRTIAAARVRRAEAESAGFQFGVSGGTAVQGAVAGITSDVAGEIGAANQQFTGQQAIVESQNRISSLQQSAATFGSIANLASSFTGAGGAQNVAAITDLVGG